MGTSTRSGPSPLISCSPVAARISSHSSQDGCADILHDGDEGPWDDYDTGRTVSFGPPGDGITPTSPRAAWRDRAGRGNFPRRGRFCAPSPPPPKGAPHGLRREGGAMSDVSQGPGWWQASDGKWYPPEQHPNYRPPPPPTAPGGAFSPMPPPGVPASPTGPPWSGPPSAPRGVPLHLWVLDPPPSPRNRLTCAVRLVMVIPQAIVLLFVNIAAFFAVIAAWFVALVSGRLAGGLREFIAGVLRWNLRVQGYFFFLSDTYPPYSLPQSCSASSSPFPARSWQTCLAPDSGWSQSGAGSCCS